MAKLDYGFDASHFVAAPGVAFTASELDVLVNDAGVGLAFFDADLRLIFANQRYATLCGYSSEELSKDADLPSLVRLSLERSGEAPETAEEVLRRSMQRLTSHGSHSFSFAASTGDILQISRRRLSDGRVVDTVRLGREQDASERMKMVADAARMRMVHALEAMADGFALFDPDDRLVAYNRQYVDLNPHIADIIAPGRPFEDMLRVAVERTGYETGGMDAETFFAWRVEEHRNPGEPYDLQMTEGRWIRVHERRTADGGVVGIRSDITELKRREAEILRYSNELSRNHMRFETALNNMVQGLCMFDADQRLVVCNRRYLEMYGFSPNVVKPGVKLSDIMEYSVSIGNYTAEDAEAAKRARPTHATKKERSTLKQYLRDGRVIAVMHQPMEDGGSIATYQDVTDLERHEQKMLAYTRELEASNRELEEFAYVASHDLQEPLRKIETFGDRLVNKFAEHLPDQAKTYIERMQNATGRMRLLINDLLAYSRITTKAKPFAPTNLKEQCEIVVSDLSVRINDSGATVEIGDLPQIDADEVQIRQLLQNLMSNALKFRREDVAPVVKVTAQILEGAVLAGVPDRVELRIADNGIGFDNKYKQQIFTIFQRLHGRNEFEGTGIGLATVRKIVERHGGEIDADGVEGEGATFIVALPVRQKQAEASNQEQNDD